MVDQVDQVDRLQVARLQRKKNLGNPQIHGIPNNPTCKPKRLNEDYFASFTLQIHSEIAYYNRKKCK